MELVKKINYPLDILTLIQLTEHSKKEFSELKSEISRLIESYGIEVLYHGDIINQRKTNDTLYDVCLILRFKSYIIHKKYIESHATDATLQVFLKTIKSRYDVELSEI